MSDGRSTTPSLPEWLREHAPDCGDNSCLFGGRGKGGMRTNGGCRCFTAVPTAKRIFIERLYASFTQSETAPPTPLVSAVAPVDAFVTDSDHWAVSKTDYDCLLDVALQIEQQLGYARKALVEQATEIAELRGALRQPSATQATIDRSEAVNLARNLRETDNIEDVTRRGILSLVDAVLRMDEFIKNSRPDSRGDHE